MVLGHLESHWWLVQSRPASVNRPHNDVLELTGAPGTWLGLRQPRAVASLIARPAPAVQHHVGPPARIIDEKSP